MEEITCSNCGSIFELITHKIFARDKDSISCPVCGNTLYSWNEAKMYRVNLKVRKELHLTNNTGNIEG